MVNWAIPNKEGSDWLISGFVKHLLYILNSSGVVDSEDKPTANRLERWAVFLRAFDCSIHHVEEEATSRPIFYRGGVQVRKRPQNLESNA